MRRAVVEDAAAIEQLTCECFGDAYTSLEEVRGFIEDERNRLYVECDEKGLAGAILFLCESKDDFMENMEVKSEDYDKISGGKGVLHHKFSVIRDDLRGRGLMTKMLDDSLKDLKEEGVYGALFTQGWIKQDTIPMEGIFNRAGYVQYKRQIRPWWKYYDRTCNICGGRCKCDSMVYYREI
ncbi:MAG: hypothetical protein K6E63_04390 [Lachnospiraceae bacterium]|nr:hypothetical protein [Lachnospiraceae bacterium]